MKKTTILSIFSLIIILCLGTIAFTTDKTDDPIKIFPIDQVKYGMKFQGKSTLGPNGFTKFNGKILGVLNNTIGPGHKLIIAELNGEPFEENVYAGQSGSPTYIDGRFLGAISYTDVFTKKAICGITPAEEELAIEDYLKRNPDNKNFNTSGTAKTKQYFEKLMTELKIENNIFQKTYISMNTTYAGSSSAQGNFKISDIQPGTVLGVQLAWGDFDLTGYGTVSYLDEIKYLCLAIHFFKWVQ